MIKDNILNISTYSINEYFNDFKEFFNENGKDIKQLLKIPAPFKAIDLSYQTEEITVKLFENHQKFLDLHYILKGEESIVISSMQSVNVKSEYNIENDYQLFEGTVEQLIILKESEFLLLFPHEIHATGIINREVSNIRKIVFKIPL